MDTRENVKALEKGLIILDMIKEAGRPLGVNEIAKDSAINLTTAFRMLQTLKNRGWVYQDANDKYIIGHKVSFVTEKTNFYQELKEVAYLTMSRLTASESQAMNLVVRENERCFILEQSRTDKIIDYVPPKGACLPLYASACGKILLMEISDFLREEILGKIELKPLTKYTLTKKTDFLQELEKARLLGYAIDMHESQNEGVCIAVPLRSEQGEIIASLSFSGFIGKISESEINYYVQLLKKAAAEITENIFQNHR